MEFDLSTEQGRIDAVTSFYVGILGRAPDLAGRKFWFDELEAARSDGESDAQILADIAESFRLAASEEFDEYSSDAQAVLNASGPEDVTDTQVNALIDQVQANAFGDASIGNGDFVSQINTELGDDDGASIGEALRDIVQSGTDAQNDTLSNRIQAGNAFAEAADQATNGNPDIDALRDAAESVNSSVSGDTEDPASEGDTAGGTVPEASDVDPNRKVNADNTGPFDATQGDLQFNIESGTYTAEIQDFDSGDVLNGFEGASVTVLPDGANQDDGVQEIAFRDSATGATSTIELTGLTSDQDSSLFNQGAIDDVFGDDTLVRGAPPADEPDDGEDGSNGENGSDGEDGADGGTTTIGPDNNDGPFDATAGETTFVIESGNYTAEIDGFDEGDVLDLFDGASTTVQPDSDQEDGVQEIEFSDSETGATATVRLTGLTADQDSSVFNAGSIDNTFGDGTLMTG